MFESSFSEFVRAFLDGSKMSFCQLLVALQGGLFSEIRRVLFYHLISWKTREGTLFLRVELQAYMEHDFLGDSKPFWS